MEKTPEITQEEYAERIEHRDALLDVRAIVSTSAGIRFFKYLFKSLEVNELPELGLEGNLLHEKMGFLRAGNSIWKLVAEANAQVAANLLAENEKESYEKLVKQFQTGQG